MSILKIIFSFISGIVGAMGLGGGSVLIIYLSAFQSLEQQKAQGINLIFFIPCALYSCIYYYKQKLLVKEIIIPFILFGTVGVFIGMKIISCFNTEILSKLFGCFLIVLAIKQLKSIKGVARK